MAKILLVEDDNNLREIYGARLTAEGYTIVAAPDGEEALAIAVKEKPDLIITDVMMPKISGFDMLDILRNAPETKDTKIIMMTALSQAEDKERADKLGADLYLVKSQVTLEDVADSVRKILNEDSAAQAAAPSGLDSSISAETPKLEAQESEPAPASSTPVQPVAPAPTPAPEPTPQAETPAPVAPAPAPVPSPAPTNDQPAATPVTDNPVVEPPAAPAAPVVPAPEPPVVTPSAQPDATSLTAEPPTPEPTPAPTPAPEPTPQAETPAPVAPAPAPVPSPAPTEPKKIEVVLPDESGQPAPTPEAAAAPIESSTPAPETPFVGPNLAEALADEEKNIKDQIKNFEETPPQPAPTPTPEPAVIQPTTPTAPNDDASVQTSDEENNPNKRIIQPLSDPTKGPDLEALVAKETSSTTEAPTPSATIEPDPSKVEGSSTTPDKTDDFSKISL